MLQRIWIAALAVAGSAAFAVGGGACVTSSPNPITPIPSLQNGPYALVAAGGQKPPQLTFIDASGRRTRVLADTIVFETATHHYIERGSIAITPVGGTEQAPTPIALGTQTYTTTDGFNFKLPVTIAGAAQATVVSDSFIDLLLADGSRWTFVRP